MLNRLMRIVVMFDLPTNTKEHRKEYTKFHSFLMRDGYDMLQYSVYARICPNGDSADKHLKRLRTYSPSKGAVRVITITNKQFAEAHIITGDRTRQEKRVTEAQMLLF